MDAPINSNDIEALRATAKSLADALEEILDWLEDPPNDGTELVSSEAAIHRGWVALCLARGLRPPPDLPHS